MAKEVNALSALRQYVAAFPTQVAASEELGIKPSYMSDLLSGKRLISDRILDKLKLRRTVVQQ